MTVDAGVRHSVNVNYSFHAFSMFIVMTEYVIDV